MGRGRVHTLHETVTRLGTLGTTTTRDNARFDEVTASVGGTWDGHSASGLTGYLTDSDQATLFRDRMAPNSRFLTPGAVEAGAAGLRERQTRVSLRDAFTFLEGDGLNGFVGVVRDEIMNTTTLTFGYAFPNPDAPSTSLLLYNTPGAEIPNNAFTINSASARLTLTLPASYPVTRCVINSDTGEITCAPATTPLIFDLIWTKDGYGMVHETSTTVETIGSESTRYHRQYNRVTATVSGTWQEAQTHAGVKMTGFLNHSHDDTINNGIP